MKNTDFIPLDQILREKNIKKYAEMKPISLSLNQEIMEIRGWTDLYVQIVREINQQFPISLKRLAKQGSSFESNGVLDIGNQQYYDKMKSPLEISTDIFLETHLTPLEIIQKIEYLCKYFYFFPLPWKVSFKKEEIETSSEFKTKKDTGKDKKTSQILKPKSSQELDNSKDYSKAEIEVSLRELNHLGEYNPVSIIINDEATKVKSWSEVHLELVHYLLQRDPKYLRSKIPVHYDPLLGLGDHRTYQDMRRPYKISENLYLDLSSNPLDINNFSELLIDSSEGIRIKVHEARKEHKTVIPTRTISLKRLTSFPLDRQEIFFQKCTPIEIHFKSEQRSENFSQKTSSWINFYFKVHSLLEELDPPAYDCLTSTNLRPNDSIAIGSLKDYWIMKEPVRTSRNHLVEIDLKYDQILENLTNLFWQCEESVKDLQIDCIPSSLTDLYFFNETAKGIKSENSFIPNSEESNFTDSLNTEQVSAYQFSEEIKEIGSKKEQMIYSSEEAKDSILEKSQKVSDISKIQLDKNFVSEKKDNNMTIESNVLSVLDNRHSSIRRISFNYLYRYKDWTPFLLQVGPKKIEVQDWQTLELQIAKLCEESKPKTLIWLSRKLESPSQLRITNSELKGELSNPIQISEDIYIDLGKDSEECLEIINNLIARLGFQTYNISVYLKSPFFDQEISKEDIDESTMQETISESIANKEINELSQHDLSEIGLEETNNLEILSSLKRRRLSAIDITWTKIPVGFQLRDQNYMVHSWEELQLCIYKILLNFNPLFLDLLNNLDDHDWRILGISKSGFQGEENLILSDSESQENLYLKIETDREKIIRSLNHLFTKAKFDKSSLLIYYVDSEEEGVKFYQKLKEYNLKIDDNLKFSLRTEVLELDIIEKEEYENTSPISFEMQGVVQTVSNWTDLYLSTFKKLVKYNPSFLQQKRNSSFIGEKKWDLTEESGRKTLDNPVEIAPHIYLETDLQTGEIIRRLQAIIPECGIDFEDYSILVKPNEEVNCEKENEETTDSKSLNIESDTSLLNVPTSKTPKDGIEIASQKNNEESNEDQAESFGNELSSEPTIIKTESTSYQRSDNDSKVDQDDLDELPAYENEVQVSSMINLEDQEDSQRDENLETSETENKEDFKPQIDSLITQYYVEESTIEEEQTSLNNLTLNQEMNQYILWMIRNGALNQDIHKSQFYFGILSQFLLDHDFIDQNLICIKDSEFLRELKEKLYLEPDFQKLNFQNYNKPRQILNDFIDYRRYK